MSRAARRHGDALTKPDAPVHRGISEYDVSDSSTDVPEGAESDENMTEHAMDGDDDESSESSGSDEEGVLEDDEELSDEEGPGYAQFIDPDDESDEEPEVVTDEDEEDTLRQRTSQNLHRNHIDPFFKAPQGPAHTSSR